MPDPEIAYDGGSASRSGAKHLQKGDDRTGRPPASSHAFAVRCPVPTQVSLAGGSKWISGTRCGPEVISATFLRTCNALPDADIAHGVTSIEPLHGVR
eukprot:3816079-Rhodomonas_salina.4